MKILIVEDDFVSRQLLKEILSRYGDCDIAINGEEALTAFQMGLKENKPYHLVCMDIMMPQMDGQEALRRIREIEKDKGISGNKEVKVLMTTALDDPQNVVEAYFRGGATSYLVKPINRQKLVEEIRALGLVV